MTIRFSGLKTSKLFFKEFDGALRHDFSEAMARKFRNSAARSS